MPNLSVVKIVHIITGLNTGGAEVALCRLLEALRAPAFEHVVIALAGNGTLSARVGAIAELHHLGMDPSKLYPGSMWRLRRIIRESAPHVVHSWMYHANVVAALVAMRSRAPLIWGVRHCIYDLKSEKPITRLVIKTGALLSSRPRHILYNSRVSSRQHEAIGYDGTKTQVIPNGFDTDVYEPNIEARQQIREELGLPMDTLLIGLVARVHPIKDHSNFLRAAALLSDICPQAHFVLAGAGADADNRELRVLINDLGLQNRVHLCGLRQDIPQICAALDIASLSSWGEAFPNAIGEAMACGVPCVATDVGDVRAIIGDTGIVVPPRDPEALCAGWARLVRLGVDARHDLGARARQRIVESYSLLDVTRQYAELYGSLVG